MPRLSSILRAAAVLPALALVLLACFDKSEPPRPYLGHWESLYRGRGGEANGMVIQSDSTVERLRFRAFDFRYSTFGDSLKLVPILPDSFLAPGDTVPPVYTNYYAVTGDTLVRSDSLQSEWLVREGQPEPGAAPIVGIWRVVRSTGRSEAVGFERFTRDSLLQVRIPANSATGTYQVQADFADTVNPDSMYLYFSDDTSRCALSFSADTLVLTRTFTNGTFSFGYLRKGDASWYRVIQP